MHSYLSYCLAAVNTTAEPLSFIKNQVRSDSHREPVPLCCHHTSVLLLPLKLLLWNFCPSISSKNCLILMKRLSHCITICPTVLPLINNGTTVSE